MTNVVAAKCGLCGDSWEGSDSYLGRAFVNDSLRQHPCRVAAAEREAAMTPEERERRDKWDRQMSAMWLEAWAKRPVVSQ